VETTATTIGVLLQLLGGGIPVLGVAVGVGRRRGRRCSHHGGGVEDGGAVGHFQSLRAKP